MTNPQIDFYVIDAVGGEQRLLLACRLADKAFRSGHRVYLHCTDAAQVGVLDELLWRFSPVSFVPHAALDSADAEQAPVRIGSGAQHWRNRDVLINLDDAVPEHFAEYARVLEVVTQEPAVLASTRDHWRHYRQLGFDPQRRELGAA